MKKNRLGQFYTREDYWIQPQITKFINNQNFDLILDPFVGHGYLLKQFNKKIMKVPSLGFDIDQSLELDWEINDSLTKIRHIPRTFILTNPPYLSRSSSKRKNINHKAFLKSKRSDVYQIAIDKMLESKIPGVAIVPESFINSKYDKKHIYSITILIPNPFQDTDTPVCVICFNPNETYKKTLIFKNDEYIGVLNGIIKDCNVLLRTKNNVNIKFNDELGKLALIAYDSQSGEKIKFLKAKNLSYSKPQKISSRVISKIKINEYISIDFLNKLNHKLLEYRQLSHDILLTPFKGNNKNHNRRRRLDYKTARKIINSIELFS